MQTQDIGFLYLFIIFAFIVVIIALGLNRFITKRREQNLKNAVLHRKSANSSQIQEHQRKQFKKQHEQKGMNRLARQDTGDYRS